MKRLITRHRHKYRKIIGVTLAIVGALIILYFIPIEFLLLIIGVGLLIMGALVLKIK